MEKTKKAKNQGDKPFLAARIPHALENALESHVKSTGESKTQSVINALSKYLNWSEDEVGGNASDRLSLLEKKVAKLESLLETPKQTNLLDIKPVAKKSKEINSETKTKNREKEKIERDPELLTHRKLSDLTGINYNSIKSNPEGKEIKWEDRKFQTTKENGRWKWREITNQHQED